MSDEESKEKRSKRFHENAVHTAKHVKIAKLFGTPVKPGEEHRLHKLNGITCGNSNCVMCMNPRKAWGEKTMQEKKFDQTTSWDEE